jgi:hypothetical protein
MHLTPDELDLLLDGRLPSDRTSHLETCDECRTAVEETREVVLRLSSLPRVGPRAGFAEQVLVRFAALTPEGEHLTPEELDDWTAGALIAPRQQHLHACAACRELADRERLLVMALERLPLFNPPPRFAQRIMAEVELPVTSLVGAYRQWHRRIFAQPVSTGVAAGIATILGGSLAASVAWAAGNQDVITGASHLAWTEGQQTFWMATSLVSQFLAQQPWYDSIRSALTPTRLALLGSGVIALYAAGLVALRRLIALPTGQVARATS